VEHFERALGRVALWATRSPRDGDTSQTGEFVQRLRVYPHAIRARNAYYSPDRVALLLGYFNAQDTDSDTVLPGGLVFTALSHDIIAHETTHALLDGLHPRFREITNRDAPAFHEAFADVVALFQHFTMPEALRQAIASTRGDLGGKSNLLAQLAVQFGKATGRRGALRDAIGRIEGNTWQPREPRPSDYASANEPHERGAVLVAAVFDAFLQIYRARGADLLRLATGGSGVLPTGDIPVDLVNRLADEASKSARHVLGMCIRALDYCPPVDINFGEYLRALVTADRDVVPDDQLSYRVAFIAAFRDRGIYPADVKSLSVDSVSWEPPPLPLGNVPHVLQQMNLDWDLTTNRRRAYEYSVKNAETMQRWLLDESEVANEEFEALGFFRAAPAEWEIGGVSGALSQIEVHSVRPARRVGPSGQAQADLVVEITQNFQPHDPSVPGFRGGCTLLIDLARRQVRYLVRKRVDSAPRFASQQKFAASLDQDPRSAYFTRLRVGDEPFALLHAG
ncbi:MAG: peptidase S8, partial [Chloroflexota bacterium]|nr:peptidase S8 [Chloroflexota bacterium]